MAGNRGSFGILGTWGRVDLVPETLRPRLEEFLGSARSKVLLLGGGMGLKPLAVGAPLDVVADHDGIALKPLAVGASLLGARLGPGFGDVAMSWVAPEPLAVVATAGRPNLALLVESDMIWS
jgi:hypothetical protein